MALYLDVANVNPKPWVEPAMVAIEEISVVPDTHASQNMLIDMA